MNSGLPKALKIGCTCVGTYLLSYCTRNLLSVSSLGIVQNGVMDKETLGMLSSVYFMIYAFGQLINGIIGDRVRPKFMVLSGLTLSGVAAIAFSSVQTRGAWLLFYALMGFGMSMLRGPLVRTISENLPKTSARIACVCFSAASFTGPLIVGICAGFLGWKELFRSFGIASIIIGLLSFTILTLLEKNGNIVIRRQDEKNSGSKISIFSDPVKIFRLPGFVTYMIVGVIVEISASSISFWIPTYMSERLLLSNEASTGVFTLISVVKALCPFLCLALLRIFHDNDILMLRVVFGISAAMYVLMVFITAPAANILFFIAALFFNGCGSALLWSVYIPGLSGSGRVSSVNGILEFIGYLGAAAANILFSNIMLSIGWSGMTFIWGCVMACGTLAALIPKKKRQ